MKIIHCSDLHLDSAMGDLTTEKAKIRKEEMLYTFEKMCEFAQNNNVKAVIIAGDMFDTKKVTAKTFTRVFGAISECADVDFLYLSGNHDEKNKFTEMDNLPTNFKIFGEEWGKIGYDNVAIAGISSDGKNTDIVYDSLKLDKNNVNIVCMHGQIAGYNANDKGELISIPKLRDKNIDYLALGHIHTFAFDKIDNRGVYVYSGCLEGRGFDELDEKGFVLLDIVDNKINYEFMPFSKRNIYELSFDVSEFADYLTMRNAVIECVLQRYNANSLIKVILIGSHKPDFYIDLDGLSAKLNEHFFFAKVYDKTELDISINDYATDKSLRGEFVRSVLGSDLDEETKNNVIMIGLRAIKGEEI